MMINVEWIIDMGASQMISTHVLVMSLLSYKIYNV